jgi:hypothetical protein
MDCKQQNERNHLSFYGTQSTGEARSDKPLAQYDFARYWYHNTVETTFKLRTASRAVQKEKNTILLPRYRRNRVGPGIWDYIRVTFRHSKSSQITTHQNTQQPCSFFPQNLSHHH